MMRQASLTGPRSPGIEWDAHSTLRLMSRATWFAAFVARHDDLDLVVREACQVAAVGVRVRFAGLLQFRADQRAFVLQAGTGWQEPEDRCVRQAADLTTTADLA